MLALSGSFSLIPLQAAGGGRQENWLFVLAQLIMWPDLDTFPSHVAPPFPSSQAEGEVPHITPGKLPPTKHYEYT